MEQFAKEVRRRGGAPADPAVYVAEYTNRLMEMVGGRWADLQSGRSLAAEWVVPHAHALLDELRRRGIALYLASGSEMTHVRHEAELLCVASFFTNRLHAPSGGDPSFTKRGVIEQLLADEKIDGAELLGFGDGTVETQEVRRVGGFAIAVASNPRGQSGIHAGKRDRLAAAGADAVISDYREPDRLLAWLFGE
jgi:phosphoglycolate phosphatase-like HAD superfamily hydrolase